MLREVLVCAKSESYTPNTLPVTHMAKLTYLAKISWIIFIHGELCLLKSSCWWKYKLKNISILCALNYSLVKWCDCWDIWKYKPIYHFQIQGYIYVQPDTISLLENKAFRYRVSPWILYTLNVPSPFTATKCWTNKEQGRKEGKEGRKGERERKSVRERAPMDVASQHPCEVGIVKPFYKQVNRHSMVKWFGQVHQESCQSMAGNKGKQRDTSPASHPRC